ncbi:hypothetical protein PT7_1820 [Pusillimonas sp. T7-7]|uniref:DUF1404 family protein n=1 Tax=Pusillimonas sp. (strain T7-7) TaxID=1007105 RepID=UPI00020844C1|nr:DUF1404 family protein [Pusillimonas sp. T7-7]AEC20360.1 hypothetical protein PT7_1820 [Pusillimonas sp. T7-7]NYT60545.1 DUF1404 family protein [Alcaligenaceae bacterium]
MRLSTSRYIAWLPGVLLVVAAVLQPWLEATMARHMGLEFPLLFVIGWLTASAAGPRLARLIEPWNAKGLTALVVTALVTAFWMVPAALDLAVLHTGVALIKVLSWLVAGMLVGVSWRQAGVVIQAFFIFNWCWMTVAVGLIYQEAPQQLCSVYLVDDQWNAGAFMVFWAVAVFILWLPGTIKSSNLLGDSVDSSKTRRTN